MSDFQTRLLEEYKQLKEKVDKLEEFIDSEKFTKVSEKQQSLLYLQLDAMEEYAWALSQRIKDLDL